jgi:hypothetical protein
MLRIDVNRTLQIVRVYIAFGRNAEVAGWPTRVAVCGDWHLRRKSAFLRFPPVDTTDLKGGKGSFNPYTKADDE